MLLLKTKLNIKNIFKKKKLYTGSSKLNNFYEEITLFKTILQKLHFKDPVYLL